MPSRYRFAVTRLGRVHQGMPFFRVRARKGGLPCIIVMPVFIERTT